MSRRQKNGMWCTKDDVMQDLALATGGGLDVDEHYLVYGERPPPKPECDIDDEMKLLFRGHALSNSKSNGGEKFAKPDLKGIMSMIRMVETEENEDSSDPIAAKPTDVIVISKLNPNVREFVPKSRAIQTLPEKLETDKKTLGTLADKKTPKKETSKKRIPSPLTAKGIHQKTPRPLAEKYTRKDTPKRMTPSPLTDKNIHEPLERMIPSPFASKNTRKETPSPLAENYTQNALPIKMTSWLLANKDTQKPLERMIPSPLADKDTAKETPSPLADKYTLEGMTSSHLADKDTQEPLERILPSSSTPTFSSATEAEINWLKDKILSKPAKDPYKHSREKNAAIATLLRHCTTPPITKDVKEKPIKLYTPEFFERCKAADFKGTEDSSTEINVNTQESIKDTVKEETNLNELTDEENNEIEHTNLTPKVAKDLKLDDAEPILSYELVEQQKSIDKVTEWLDGPKSPKKFKKPVIHSGPIAYKRKEVMSPSTTSTTIEKKISKQDDKAYVPSSYAAELRMKYEKNTMEANKSSTSIWDKLETQLKNKDEEIRKKLGQQD